MYVSQCQFAFRITLAALNVVRVPASICAWCLIVYPGQLLTSVIGDRRLQMLPHVSYKFVSVGPASIDGTDYNRLLELWILPDSPDLPIANLCAPDGGWRSGDLFEESEPGKYLFRGRDDDWIKSLWGERLDTK